MATHQTLEVPTASVPRGLPPKARARLDVLGPGTIAQRTRLVELCGSEGAADQFYVALAPKGYLVPVRWGRYAIPRPETLRKLAILPPGPVGQAVSWAETLPWALQPPMEFGLLSAASWADPQLNIPSPAPVFAIPSDAATLEGTAPQLEAFFADLQGPVGTLRLVDQHAQVVAQVPRLHPMDEARLLLHNADTRIHEAGKRLAASLSRKDREKMRVAVQRTAYPEPAPRGRRTVRLPTGPPSQHRLYVPSWFLTLHQQALDAQARRRLLGKA